MSTTIDLGAIATKTMEEIVASGVIEKDVKNAIEKTISRTIEDLLGSWSCDFGKQFKETVKDKLAVDFKSIEIPLYNEYLIKTAQEMTDEAVKKHGVASFAEILERMLKTEIKQEYKLSELIEAFKDDCGDGHDHDDCMTLFIEKTTYGSIRVDINEDECRRYECKYRFFISKEDNHVFGVDIENSKTYAEKLNNAGTFGRLLMQLQLAGSRVILDEGEDADDYNTQYREDEDC